MGSSYLHADPQAYKMFLLSRAFFLIFVGAVHCLPVEVLNQSELQESLLEMTKMTAEELAAYSKVQSLLKKIAKPTGEAKSPVIQSAKSRVPIQTIQVPQTPKPYPRTNINSNLPSRPQPNIYRPNKIKLKQSPPIRYQPKRTPPKYNPQSNPRIQIHQNPSNNNALSTQPCWAYNKHSNENKFVRFPRQTKS